MKYADLHVHTNESDGTSSPEKLVKEAARAGLYAVGIVDHDTVSALAPAMAAAKASGVEIVPGIELTAQYEGQEIHILGYYIDYRNEQLLEKLLLVRQDRVERVIKIVNNLKEMGVHLDAQAVFDISGNATVGRMHVARALVKEGLVGSTGEAFQRYIGDKSPAYVLGFKFSPAEAIKLIRECGGVAVLAHPYIIHNDSLIPQFVKDGLMGLEAYYPEHSQSMINFYLGLAKELDLLVTGGSDFHGSAKPDVKLGKMKIPWELVEKLKAASRNKND
ncbi:MAG: PHP domain-containing protein [Candidatus Omnitrophota bacterium]